MAQSIHLCTFSMRLEPLLVKDERCKIENELNQCNTVGLVKLGNNTTNFIIIYFTII